MESGGWASRTLARTALVARTGNRWRVEPQGLRQIASRDRLRRYQSGWSRGHSNFPEASGDKDAEISSETLRISPDSSLGKRQRVEAILFMSRTPIASRKLAQMADLADATEARTLVRQLNQVYQDEERAFRVEEIAGGFQLMTRPQVAPWLRRLGHLPKTVQLTQPALETIAIIAYRQPVMRADIEAIRGVSCGEILRQLMERDLVRISGRSEELGRPYLYSTTRFFLQTFGLRGADALPALEMSEIEFSEQQDWSAQPGQADPEIDLQPVVGTPVENCEMSIAVAKPFFGLAESQEQDFSELALNPSVAPPQVVMDDDDEDGFLEDDDEEDDFEDDEDEDWEDDDLEEDEDADWEEVEEDEDWEEDEEDSEDDDLEDEEEEGDVEEEEDEDEDEEWDDDDDEDDDLEDDEDEWD